jgi:DNA-binding Lrp family transcriptional regulator
MINLKTQTKRNNNEYQNNKYNTSILLEEPYEERSDEDSISIADLRKTDIDILKILSENEDENIIAIFSFNGLKIRLNLHQEILSRSLKRLKELGLIYKTKLGYKSTKNGKTIFSKLKKLSNEKKDEQKYNQIIQISVPFVLPNQQIVQSLSGKWFNCLRWIGMTQNASEYQLKWKNIETFIEIVVYLTNNNISIETNDSPLNISRAFGYSTRIIDEIGNVIMKNNSTLFPIHNNDFEQIPN